MPDSKLPDIVLTNEEKKDIALFLEEHISRSLRLRSPAVEKWKKIQEYYEKMDLPEKKDFPFPNAAHLMVTVIANYTEKMQARIFKTIWMPSDPYNVAPIRKELAPYVKACRRWITWAVREELELRRKSLGQILEMCKLGDCVGKIVYSKEYTTEYVFNDAEDKWEAVAAEKSDNPILIHIPLPHFLWAPYEAKDLEDTFAQFHMVPLTWNDLLKRESAEIYKDVERVKAHAGEKEDDDDYMQALRDLDEIGEKPKDVYNIWECWFEYKPKNAKYPRKYVAHFHRESKTLLRIKYNTYPLQLHPFEMAGYIRREHRILSIGVGHCALPTQIEVSVMHNQRLDKNTIANALGYKYKEDSDITPNMPITPGMGVPVAEMDDFDTFQWGSGFDSTIQDEEKTISYLEDRLGMTQADKLDAVTSTNAMLAMQERATKSDMVIDNFRDYMTRVMEKAILLYQAHYPEDRLVDTLGEDGALVAALFKQYSPRELRKGLGVSITAQTSQTSKEMQRQSKLSLFNLVTQYYGQATQYYMQAQNPQLPPEMRVVLLEIVIALSEFVLEVFEDFDLYNREEFTIKLDRIRQMAANAAAQIAAQPPAQPPGLSPGGDPAQAGGPQAGAQNAPGQGQGQPVGLA